jgi:glutamyl-tRNA synthetase
VIRGRLAPTPSGLLHLGNARSFLLAWLWAKSAGGGVLLRIEDIDKPRCKPEFTNAVLEDLAWLGLTYESGAENAPLEGRQPLLQSECTAIYRGHLRRLIDAGLAYPCTCRRRDIEEASSAPHGDDGPVYPGTCRGRWRDAEHASQESGREPALRFLWDSRPVVFRDELQGEVAIDPSILGDFVLWRRDDLPSYQLAVTVDDALQGITQVLRGRDLLHSTARQLALYAALELAPPQQWAHVPLMQDAGGRMAKRDGSMSLKSLREAGARPERILGLLAWSAGLLPEFQPTTANELISRFDIGAVGRNDFALTQAHIDLLFSSG